MWTKVCWHVFDSVSVSGSANDVKHTQMTALFGLNLAARNAKLTKNACKLVFLEIV